MTDARFIANILLVGIIFFITLLTTYCVMSDRRDALHQAHRESKFASFHKPSEFADDMKADELNKWLHSGATYKFNDGLTAAQLESWHKVTNYMLKEIR